MITPEFLQSCTDEQINKGVAWLTFKEWSAKNNHKRKSLDYYCCQGLLNSIKGDCVNYCTNPNDAWPIITTERIGIKPRGVDSDWYAYSGKFEVINENPLRAVMEVYILMSTQS